MTTEAWIAIYLLVSLGVALAAWRESARIDRVRRFGRLRRLIRDRKFAATLKLARAWGRLAAAQEAVARVIGDEMAASFAAAQRSLDDFVEAWGRR
jgi:hypothetical protein